MLQSPLNLPPALLKSPLSLCLSLSLTILSHPILSHPIPSYPFISYIVSCLCLCLCHLSIYRSIHQSIHSSIQSIYHYLSLSISIYLSIDPSIHSSIYQSINLSIYLSIYLYLSVVPFVPLAGFFYTLSPTGFLLTSPIQPPLFKPPTEASKFPQSLQNTCPHNNPLLFNLPPAAFGQVFVYEARARGARPGHITRDR